MGGFLPYAFNTKKDRANCTKRSTLKRDVSSQILVFGKLRVVKLGVESVEP